MKFIKCLDCQDLVALRYWNKSCKCGKCSGYYEPDNTSITVSGIDMLILGFPNDQFFEIPFSNKSIKWKKE